MNAMLVRSLLVALIVILGTAVPFAPPSHAQDATPGAVSGNRFESEQFGYVLEWEEPWGGATSIVGELFEGLMLSDGNKMASLIAMSADGGQLRLTDDTDALDLIVGDLVSQVPDATVVDQDRNADPPWAALAYAGITGPARSFVQTFTLAEEAAYLIAIVEAPTGEYQQALRQAAEGITLNGESFVSPPEGLIEPDSESEQGRGDDRDLEDQSPPSAVEAVPSYRGGAAHSGEQPGPAPLEPLTELWTFATGDDWAGAVTPAVSTKHGLLFTSSNAVYAVDLETGEEVWSFKSTMGFVSPPVVGDDKVFAAGEDGSVYALAATSGDVVWEAEISPGMPVNGGPLFSGDLIFGTSWAGIAFALDARTGELIWATSLGGMSTGQPAYDDGYLVLPAPLTEFNGVVALDATNGEEAWRFKVADAERDPDSTAVQIGPSVYAVPSIADGVVYLNSEGGLLYALDLESGDELWSTDTGSLVAPGPAVAGDVVYAVSGSASLGAYDANSGEELWSVEVGGPSLGIDDGTSLGAVVVTQSEDGDRILLAGDDNGVLRALAEDGKQVFAVQVTAAPISLPVTAVDGVVYVPDRDGAVVALASRSGRAR